MSSSSDPFYEDEEELRPEPAASVPPAAAPPSPPVTTEVSWGSIRPTRKGTLSEGGGTGLIRHVGAGIGYQAPPVGRTWERAPRRPQVYEMAWDGDPASARTLARLGADLRARAASRRLSADDADLALLDRAWDHLLALAAELHARSWRLGLLHPENVVLAEGPDRPQPVLVDLGFWFDVDSPGPPDWLTENPYAELWDESPVQRQRGPAHDRGPTVASDVKLLARLLTCVLTGEVSRAPQPPSPKPAPVWEVIDRALRGEVTAIADLRKTFRSTEVDARPSRHFLAPRVVVPQLQPTSRGGRGWGGLLVLLVAVGLLGGLAYVAMNRPPPVPTSREPEGTAPDEPPPVPSGARAAELVRKAREAPPETLPPVIKEINDLPASEIDEALRAQWLAFARKRYLDDWVKRYDAADARSGEPDDRLAAADRLQKLHDELAELNAKVPPPEALKSMETEQCLEPCALRVRELRSLP